MDSAETGAVRFDPAYSATGTTPACRKERDKAGAPWMKGYRERMDRPAERHTLLFLLHFGVFGFGFVEQGNVGVGVFPVRKEILVGDAAARVVALQGVGAGQSEMSQDE